ncbi:trimeric intracellular cation channel family protein [Motiliproteus coralliicola]|uniref:Trimeric intracellular cation channel family protein n=1 Tax=Motiliproteus coralliicola TaxID=2283196 RepID=A0A369WMY1_9GAMM|nr:trimeric intracellular cation channel family protein [Motiliproteus coralliicola]RDE23037.1 trimeric intracellular cation channel family protein [Motiliproteus coralliicola]
MEIDLYSVVNVLGLSGIAVFAVSGALDAARQKMDILGFMLIGCATGLGGGTLRDLLLGNTPVYWVREPIYVATSLSAAVLTYFVVPYIASRTRSLLWMDAIGMALFSVTGAQIALSSGASSLIAACMGVMTASFGGIIRDVLCGSDLVLSSRELYVSASLAGASTYLMLEWLAVPESAALIGGFVAALVLRGGAILFSWTLPAYHRD